MKQIELHLVKQEAAWPSFPVEERQQLRREGERCLDCKHPDPSSATGCNAISASDDDFPCSDEDISDDWHSLEGWQSFYSEVD